MIDFTSFTTIVIIIVVLYLLSSIKILREYERGVIFRLGRVLPQPKGPGRDSGVRADRPHGARFAAHRQPSKCRAQDVVTRDNVTVKVNAVIYFRVVEPRLAVVEVANFLYATSQLAQTTLRSVLGEVELDELLSQREKLNVRLQAVLDQHTAPWGVKVTHGGSEAGGSARADDPRHRAARPKPNASAAPRSFTPRANTRAAENLAMAAEVIQKQPAAIQLRYLQTLVEIGIGKEHHHCFPAAARYTLIFGARA